MLLITPLDSLMDSKIALIIQLTGVVLITILTISLQRSLKAVALKYWTYAWLCLSFSLLCLRLAFSFEQPGVSLISLYFFGEYLFGYMLIAGCKSLHDETKSRIPSELLIVPFGIIAIGLPMLSATFDVIYSIHSLILSGFFITAFLAIRKSSVKSFGVRLMGMCLALLALDFLLFFTVHTARQFVEFPIAFLQYSSVLDVVLETALGFGMVITLLENLVADLKTANEKLEEAHLRLKELAHTDPLTAAFNRHALYGFVKKNGETSEPTSGCVGFFDIDDLKGINDRYGHAAGDQAIRLVARAIREVIRAEDLIYRWGGDEFFVIMITMQAEQAQIRMQRLEGILTGIRLDDVQDPMNISVSCGFTDFEDSTRLESAMKGADAEMYRRKQSRKERSAAQFGYLHSATENPSEIRI